MLPSVQGRVSMYRSQDRLAVLLDRRVGEGASGKRCCLLPRCSQHEAGGVNLVVCGARFVALPLRVERP